MALVKVIPEYWLVTGVESNNPSNVMVAAVRAVAAERAHAPPDIVVPEVPAIGTHEDPTLSLHTRLTD